MERKAKAATESGFILLIIFAILVAVNALSALGVYRRVDMTASERFTLSNGSATLLRSMKQNMQVDAYVTKGLPKLDVFVRDLRDLLQEYKDASGGKFDYQIIEAKDEDQKKAATDAGLKEQPFGEASATQETAAITQGFMGLVFKYGTEKDAIPFLPPERSDGLEFWITNKIREIRDRGDDVKHKIGVLSGVEEIKLSEANLVPAQMGKPSIQEIISRNFPFYKIEDVDLGDGENAIDDSLDGLIITQPGKDLSEKALRRIDEFVMKGKSLVVVASAVNIKESDAKMNAKLDLHGLDRLLKGYGVEMRKDVVLDYGRSFRVNVLTQGGIASAAFPQFLNVQEDQRFDEEDERLLDTSFPAFFRIPEVAMPFCSSIVLHSDRQPEAELKVLARSTPRSNRKEGETVDLNPFQRPKPKPPFEQYAVAAAVEGTLKTAFPEGDKKGIDAPAKSKQAARVLVISSSQFLANPLARAGNGPAMPPQMGMMMPQGGDEQLLSLAGPYAQQALTGTILVFKNTLDWMTGDTELLAVSAKILSEPNLVYGDVNKPNWDEEESEEEMRKRAEELKAARQTTQHKVEAVLILGLPLLVAAYGIFRWRRRLSLRAHVSLA